eukprot:5749792-Amphidinium_carterae.1
MAELDMALGGEALRLATAKSGWSVVAGPAGAMLATCVRLRIVVKSATHLEIAGEMLDLRHIGQKRLEKLVDHQTACWSERIATQPGDRTAALHFASARAAHAALPTPLQQSIFVHVYSHGAWCQQKLHERGGAERPNCLLCGQNGSFVHRWLTCPHWRAERQKRLTVRQREFAAKWAQWDI